LDAQQIQEALLRQYKIRVGLQTADYVRDHLVPEQRPTDGRLAVIGLDARTGAPLRTFIVVDKLNPAASAPSLAAGNLFAGTES
jgi:hypothetical protein